LGVAWKRGKLNQVQTPAPRPHLRFHGTYESTLNNLAEYQKVQLDCHSIMSSSPPMGMLSFTDQHWAEHALDDIQYLSLDSDDDPDSSTASLTSIVLAFRTLHGRTYNSDSITDTQSW
jgi:hypothetical protein